MGVYVGSDGAQFLLGWVDDKESRTPWIHMGRSWTMDLYRRLGLLLDMPNVEAELARARARIKEQDRAIAALRGHLARRKVAA